MLSRGQPARDLDPAAALASGLNGHEFIRRAPPNEDAAYPVDLRHGRRWYRQGRGPFEGQPNVHVLMRSQPAVLIRYIKTDAYRSRLLVRKGSDIGKLCLEGLAAPRHNGAGVTFLEAASLLDRETRKDPDLARVDDLEQVNTG